MSTFLGKVLCALVPNIPADFGSGESLVEDVCVPSPPAVGRRQGLKLHLRVALSSFFLTSILFSVPLSPACAEDPLTLHFAGFAEGGEASQAATAFPYTNEILKLPSVVPAVNVLDSALTSERLSSDRLTVTTDSSSDSSTDPLALAFVLTWENLAQDPVPDGYKVTADLRAEAMIFDFHSKKLIAAFPFGKQVRTLFTHQPSEDEKRGLFLAMYTAPGDNIFDQFASVLQSADVRRSYGLYAQITSVALDDRATSSIRNLGVAVNDTQLRSFIAGAFEASLTKNLGIPLIPSEIGQAIGGKMTARFANGDVYDISLPKPDYQIQLTLRGFKKVVVGENDVETVFAFANFFHIAVIQPLRGQPYLDADLKYAVTKTLPAGIQANSDWASYQESMLSFLEDLSRQFQTPDPEWAAKWAGSADISDQFSAAGTALSKCR